MERDGRDRMKKSWAPETAASIVVALLILIPRSAPGEIADWDAAVRPLDEGVPQVAVMRLRNILKQALAPGERKTVLAKLGEALLASDEPAEALKVLDDPTLQDLPATLLWRAQALAALGRWSEALPLYQQVAAQNPAPFRNTALFGQAETLRALQRFDEASRIFAARIFRPQRRPRDHPDHAVRKSLALSF